MFYYLFWIRTLHLRDLHYGMYHVTQMYVCSLYVKYSQAKFAFCKDICNFFLFLNLQVCVDAAGKHSMKLLVSQLTSKVSPGSVSWVQIPQLRSEAGTCFKRRLVRAAKAFFHVYHIVVSLSQLLCYIRY
jgi:hypothetical protein